MTEAAGAVALNIFLVASEASGDRLGAALMRVLRAREGRPIRFFGFGGPDMAAAGLDGSYPLEDFSIVGFNAIPTRLPRILGHLFKTVRAVLVQRPDVLVIIDSPGYTHLVARGVRLFNRSIPIIDYVSPSVWAWRSGRARAMRRYIDHVLALLPFEPDAHRRLGGPPCTYVGHPLIEEASSLRPNSQEAARRHTDPPIVLAMLGSRSGEVERLAGVFGQALRLVGERAGPIEVVVPTVAHLLPQVTAAAAGWPMRPRVITAWAEKQAAFRSARVALAKSGTVTLELAVAGVPTVGAYRVSAFDAWVARRLVKVHSVILANLVLGRNVVPEFLQEDCTPERLADALVPLLGDTPERRAQVDAFASLDTLMEIGMRAPAARAAEVVLGMLRPPASPMAGCMAGR